MKPIVLSLWSLFSTVTLQKTKTFLHILGNEPMKTFGSCQSSIMKEHKTKDCAAPLKFAKFHNHSPLLTSYSFIRLLAR